jgi:catechol 2,3-dioxygenase-like lactoylglutathione lyase family enzyme
VTARNYFHIGILVKDIEQARARFSEVLGLTFTPVQRISSQVWEEGRGMVQMESALCYSEQGPPYYELVEASGDGVLNLAQGEGLHHIGLYEADVEARLEELARLGLKAEMRTAPPDGDEPAWIAYVSGDGLHGVRTELVWEGRRSALEHFIRTGTWTNTQASGTAEDASQQAT